MSTAELLTSLQTKISTLGELAKQGTGADIQAILDSLIDRSITTMTIPSSITAIGSATFFNCNKMTTLYIPNTITTIGTSAFTSCIRLEFVTIQPGFNADSLNLSYSTKYSADTLVAMFNALADRTGQTAFTLTLGSTNLAKLSAAQIAIATQKNWNLA